MTLYLKPGTIFKSLLKIIFFLLICQLIVVSLKLIEVGGFFKSIIYFFDFDRERNLPTFFSSLSLLASSILLFIISIFHKNKKLDYIRWLGLSIIFVFLSIDEITVIHEQLWPLQMIFNTSGLLYYAWFVPYVIVLIILIFVYARFFFRLPKKVKYLFVLSGVFFLSGAVGIESISGFHDQLNGRENAIYYTLCTFEELFEMFGTAIFIYALLIYISDMPKQLNIKFT